MEEDAELFEDLREQYLLDTDEQALAGLAAGLVGQPLCALGLLQRGVAQGQAGLAAPALAATQPAAAVASRGIAGADAAGAGAGAGCGLEGRVEVPDKAQVAGCIVSQPAQPHQASPSCHQPASLTWHALWLWCWLPRPQGRACRLPPAAPTGGARRRCAGRKPLTMPKHGTVPATPFPRSHEFWCPQRCVPAHLPHPRPAGCAAGPRADAGRSQPEVRVVMLWCSSVLPGGQGTTCASSVVSEVCRDHCSAHC